MNDQQIKLTPANSKNNLLIYIAGFVGLAILLYSDAMALAHSLITGYPLPIPYLLGFGIVLVIDLCFWGFIFALRNLFAYGKISNEIWAFYLFVALALGSSAGFGSWLVKSHIDALGAKNRRILSPFDYSKNPALIAAEKNVNELAKQIEATDKTIMGMSQAVAQASMQASSFSVSYKQALRDTSISNRQKNDLAYYAGRANKTSAASVSAMAEMQKERQRMATALLAARDHRSAVFDSLSQRFAGKSAEDVVESDMGIGLKTNIAWATQISALAIFVLFMMLKAANTGKLEYNPIAFVPANELNPALVDPQRTGVGSTPSTAPDSFDFIMPNREPNESKREYALRVAQLYRNGAFPEYVNGTYLSGRLKIHNGTFSKLVHGRLGKTYSANRNQITAEIVA